MRLRRVLVAAVLAAATTAAAHADAPRTLPLLREGMISHTGPPGMQATHDLDRDGVRDLVTCGTASGHPFALAKRGNAFATIWYSEKIHCSAITVGDRNDDGAPEIFAAAAGSNSTFADTIYVFDPRSPGATLGSVMVPGGQIVAGLAVGDPDHDGHLEVVAVTGSATHVFDAKTLALEWTAADTGGTQVAIGNIDDDGRIEVVVNGSTGRVLDVVARTAKWSYAGGFGDRMVLGNVDGDAELEIVFTAEGSTQVQILEGDTISTSSIQLTSSARTLALADTTGDAIAEILTIDSQSSDVHGYRRSDAAELWTVDSPVFGSWGMTAGDVDGDGVVEVIWSGYEGDVFIASTASEQVEWSSAPVAPWYRIVIDDLDGDGRLEQIVASTSWGNHDGRVEILDLATRVSKAVLLMNDSSSVRFPFISDLAVGQLDSDPAKEILINSGSLAVWDGATYEHEWTSPAGGYAMPVVVLNIDADPVDEIVVGTVERKIVALDGASAAIQWSTDPLDGHTVKDLAVADVNANGALDVVVGMRDYLYVIEHPSGTVRLRAFRPDLLRVAATAGEVAVATDNIINGRLRTYSGTTLTQSWECTTTQFVSALAYANVGGRVRLAAGMEDGELRLYTPGGNTCPTAETKALGRGPIGELTFLDVTGDGRNELLFTQMHLWSLHLLGWQSEPRGDVNLDGTVNDADIDALVAYLLAGAPGAPPGADVNGDARIALDDVFYLIDYRKGTGAAPPP